LKKIAFFFLIFIGISCKFDETISTKPTKFGGYVADQYDKGNAYPDFKTKDTSPVVFPMKFENFKDYMFVQDYGKGIHVFQVKGLATPIKVALIEMAASTDFSIKNDVLTINSAKKVFFLNLSKLDAAIAGNATISVIKIVDNVVLYPNYPPLKNTIFACPDTTLGFVKAWRKDSIAKIECFR
jgi:hypothetical protein